MSYHASIKTAFEKLLQETDMGFPFTVIMKHGTMTVEFFVPQEVDSQTPHKQDEIYIIAKGHGTLYRNGEHISCKQGDILFVPAGMEHYFGTFSSDFATWVIFYGPEGGEKEDKTVAY